MPVANHVWPPKGTDGTGGDEQFNVGAMRVCGVAWLLRLGDLADAGRRLIFRLFASDNVVIHENSHSSPFVVSEICGSSQNRFDPDA